MIKMESLPRCMCSSVTAAITDDDLKTTQLACECMLLCTSDSRLDSDQLTSPLNMYIECVVHISAGTETGSQHVCVRDVLVVSHPDNNLQPAAASN